MHILNARPNQWSAIGKYPFGKPIYERGIRTQTSNIQDIYNLVSSNSSKTSYGYATNRPTFS